MTRDSAEIQPGEQVVVEMGQLARPSCSCVKNEQFIGTIERLVPKDHDAGFDIDLGAGAVP